MPVSGEAVVSELKAGIQRAPWIGNCVAIGEAAIAVDPIDALDLHVTHGCISHLMSLFPATAGEFLEAEAYNRSVRSFGSNLRDFQAAHYLLNRRFDDRFWDLLRDADMPTSLKRKVEMFSARGRAAQRRRIVPGTELGGAASRMRGQAGRVRPACRWSFG